MLGITDDACLHIASIILPLTTKTAREFWPLARQIKERLSPAETPDGLRQHALKIQGLIDMREGVLHADQVRQTAFANEGVISNLGVISYNTDFGHLKLIAVWGPVTLSLGQGQYVSGVTTVNGTLRIMMGTREEVGGLVLERMAHWLTTACEELLYG